MIFSNETGFISYAHSVNFPGQSHSYATTFENNTILLKVANVFAA